MGFHLVDKKTRVNSGRNRPQFFVLVCVLALVLVFMGLILRVFHQGPLIGVGEEMVYGVYVGGNRAGTMTFWVEGTESFDGVACYVGRYSMMVGDTVQAGRMVFDKQGRLRHAKIALVENRSLKWSTEIGYSRAVGVMRIIFEDNRNPENYSVTDNAVLMPGETVLPAYLWYRLRMENLGLGYQLEFYINVLPQATTLVPARVAVRGEERVDTPIGRFDCWVIKGENTTSGFWITKDRRLVVKAVEEAEGVSWLYVLEKHRLD